MSVVDSYSLSLLVSNDHCMSLVDSSSLPYDQPHPSGRRQFALVTRQWPTNIIDLKVCFLRY